MRSRLKADNFERSSEIRQRFGAEAIISECQMKRSTVLAVLAVLVVTLVIGLAGIFFPASPKETLKVVITGKEWLNTEFGRDRLELKGKNTLVVFWNASDINSLKTVKKLNEWKAQYGGLLQIAGIHCPEFEFEKEKKNIVRLVEELKIKWPVLLDNDGALKKIFKNTELPALYLINSSGKTVYTHKGDGDYEISEAEFQAAVKVMEPNATLPKLKKPEIAGVCFIITPDLYTGSIKGLPANKGGFIAEKLHDYKFNAEIPPDAFALKGKFKALKEYVESETPGSGLFLNFAATEVNIVADSVLNGDTMLEVLLDNKPVKPESRGRNLDGNNQVRLKYPGMYQLLKNTAKAEKGILSVKLVKGKCRLYAFRFYGCSE